MSNTPPCPTNQVVGHSVDTLTLKALLAVPLTHLTQRDYYFCPAADCPTVYYSGDGQQLFDETELREKVYQKHSADDETVICYCFRHTVGDLRAELDRTSLGTVPDQITAGIRAGQCACDLRNPEGRCCLGNVRQAIERLARERG
jgi:hypothetical protein